MIKNGIRRCAAGILLTAAAVFLFSCQRAAEVSVTENGEAETSVSAEERSSEEGTRDVKKDLAAVREGIRKGLPSKKAEGPMNSESGAAMEEATLGETEATGEEANPEEESAGGPEANPDSTGAGGSEPASAGTEPPAPEPIPEQSFAAQLQASAGVSQLIVVEASGTGATVTMHQRNGAGLWEEIYRTSGYVGWDGVGNTTEYNSAAPAGVYTLGPIFGTEPDPGCPRGYIQVDDSYYWVDDVDSVYYNQMISTRTEGIDENAFQSAENLGVETTAYAYVAAINYNTACIPGEGSAIFLHVSEGIPTQGCVSVPREAMVFFLTHLAADTRIVIGNSSGAFALSQY